MKIKTKKFRKKKKNKMLKKLNLMKIKCSQEFVTWKKFCNRNCSFLGKNICLNDRNGLKICRLANFWKLTQDFFHLNNSPRWFSNLYNNKNKLYVLCLKFWMVKTILNLYWHKIKQLQKIRCRQKKYHNDKWRTP